MYKSNGQGFLKHIDFLLLDCLMVHISFVISYILRYGMLNPYQKTEYRQIVFLYTVFFVMTTIFMDSYNNIIHRGYYAELKQTIKTQTLVSGVFLGYLFVTRTTLSYSRYVIILSWLIEIYLIYMLHIIWKSILLQKIRENSGETKMVLLVPDAATAKEVLDECQKKILGFHVVSIFTTETHASDRLMSDIPVHTGIDVALSYISEHVVDEVMICMPEKNEIPHGFIEDCLNMGIVVHQNLREWVPSDVKREVTKTGDYLRLTSYIGSATPRQMFIKRMIDIVGSLVGLLITGIAYVFVAPVIRAQSPGPVFFKQQRVGKNGRRFYIYKFRSMYMDAEERKAELMSQNKMKGPIAKFDNDPRIFPFGKVIRRLSIDELPQFWNVLKGDMSLVGTRPPTVDEYEQYELHHKKRLCAQPGLTGKWQVSGRSDIEDFEEIVRMDSEYIENWHLSSDIKILLQTLFVVLRGKGAE